MSIKKQKSFSHAITVRFTVFFRGYPAVPYIVKWLLITVLIGSFIGSASAGFLLSLDWVTNYRESHQSIINLLPIAGMMIGLLYYYWGKDIEGGNNLLLETIQTPKPIIPFKMAPFVFLGTIITHLFGGSAGREGTALQMAGAIADQFSKPLKLTEADRKTLLIAAVAAGFGSVFGTPLAGAIFALEVFLIGSIKYDAILPAFFCAIIADLVTKTWGLQHTHYQIELIPYASAINIIYAIIAGIAFGLCAATFSKSMKLMSSWFKLIRYPPLRPLAGGIIVVLAVELLGTTKFIGLGIPTILTSFEHQLPAYDFALKIAFTIITLAAGFKGGEVTPLFFIGALFGNALSYLIPLPVGLLAGMGFVAVFAGATNTPLACAIMAIELFGIECGIYVSIACIISYLLSGHNSIYTKQMIGEPKHRRFTGYEGKRLNEL